MKPKLSDLWRWQGELGRGAFCFWGVLLAAIKYNLDRLIALIWFDGGWTIFDPETVKLYLWQSPLKATERPYIIRTIHLRVLHHVKQLSEGSAP